MAGALADVVVLGASDMGQAYSASSLTIGGLWDPDTGQMSATDTVLVDTVESGAGRSVMETTRIACVVFAGSGDVDLVAHRAKANGILTALRDALRSLTDVGTSSARAEIASQQWAQIVDEQGSGVVVAFEVIVMVLP